MNQNFVHLHTHSEYSLLDGAARIKDLFAKAKEFGMPALALTDHGVMYGAIEFYETAKKYGIKPIIGCEAYIAPRSRFDKSSKKEEAYHHLTILAGDNQGYRNLLNLVTLGFFEGFYYKPRLDLELLEKHHQGLIVLSGCITGEIPQLILERKLDRAKDKASQYREIFGEKNFFLELQAQGLENQDLINQGLIKISKELKIPSVLTNDIHYAQRSDYTAHDALLCIQTGSALEDEERLKFGSDEFYLKSPEEMKKLFPDLPEAYENTLKIAERCEVALKFGQVYLPAFEAPEEYDLNSYLEKLCRQGLAEKYPELTSEIENRLTYELEVIKKTGFSGYFLVVWDFIKFAKEKGIRVGPGRGSAAGSIVAYVLGITSVDPLTHGLFFERFLNPERVSLPDIDIDFDEERRDEVIAYVTNKYGQDKVAQIVTFGTMKARAAIRDSGRVFNVPYGKVDKIAKMVPHYPGTTLEEALKSSPELQKEYQEDEVTKKIIDTAKALEGLARHDSTHAAGVVISREKLSNYTPLQRKEAKEVVTQYPMEDIEKIGLLKIDFLGLRTLTVIENTVKIVAQTTGEKIDLDRISFEDERTFELLRRGESIGIFQLESSGMRSLLKELQPTSFEDLVNLLALYRPGPLDSGMVQDFVERKRGRKPVSYLHPKLEPILKSTHGAIVYQEQVMQIARDIAGFSLGEADILRKAMSKPNPKVFAKQREKFVKGAVLKGMNESTAGEIFNLVAHFAGYGFNKSHSCGYAVIAYQTAYLKANFLTEFMAALLTSIMGNKDKVAGYVNECRRQGIEVLPPDINESFAGFTVVKKNSFGQAAIRFGLSAVRNVGGNAIESIVKSRQEKGPFKSLFDFCARVDLRTLNKRALESLIKSGAFDSFGSPRKYLLGFIDQAVEAGVKKQRDLASGQFTFFDFEESLPEETLRGKGSSGPEAPRLKTLEEFPKEELLSQEKEMLGLYVSDHPLLRVEKALKARTQATLTELKEKRDGTILWVGGIISKVSQITTKKGELMAFLTLEDLESSVEVIVFPAAYQKYRPLLGEDRIVRLKGRLDVKEETVKIIAQEIEALTPEKQESKRPDFPVLYIKLPLGKFHPKLIENLKGLFKTYPGSSPVYLRLEDNDKVTTFRLGKEFMVKPERTLFGALKELLGEEALSLNQKL